MSNHSLLLLWEIMTSHRRPRPADFIHHVRHYSSRGKIHWTVVTLACLYLFQFLDAQISIEDNLSRGVSARRAVKRYILQLKFHFL